MEYTRGQVIEIINNYSSELNADLIIDNWQEKKSNELLDLSKYEYPLFCYSFPIIINGIEQATVSLFNFYCTGIDNQEKELVNKYLGYKKYNSSWVAFSHDTYLHCYLSINDELVLPKSTFLEDFYCFDGLFEDSNGEKVKYKIAYGNTETESDNKRHEALKYSYEDTGYDAYHFLSCGITLMIEDKKFEGYSMGEEINKRIEERKNK